MDKSTENILVSEEKLQVEGVIFQPPISKWQKIRKEFIVEPVWLLWGFVNFAGGFTI